MVWLLAAVAMAAGCMEDADFGEPHALATCAASPSWDLNGDPSMHVGTCEAACVTEPAYTGPGCSAVCAEGRDCQVGRRCNRTFTTADGWIGCCEYVGTLASGIDVLFLECE